jgi:hypothetical protein
VQGLWTHRLSTSPRGHGFWNHHWKDLPQWPSSSETDYYLPLEKKRQIVQLFLLVFFKAFWLPVRNSIYRKNIISINE